MSYSIVSTLIVLLAFCKKLETQKQSNFWKSESVMKAEINIEECWKTPVSPQFLPQCLEFGLTQRGSTSDILMECRKRPVPEQHMAMCKALGLYQKTEALQKPQSKPRHRDMEKMCYADPIPHKYFKYCVRYGFNPNLPYGTARRTHRQRMIAQSKVQDATFEQLDNIRKSKTIGNPRYKMSVQSNTPFQRTADLLATLERGIMRRNMQARSNIILPNRSPIMNVETIHNPMAKLFLKVQTLKNTSKVDTTSTRKRRATPGSMVRRASMEDRYQNICLKSNLSYQLRRECHKRGFL